MAQSSWVHLDVAEIKRITDKAMLIVLDDGYQHWFPLSHVSEADKYNEGDRNLTVSVSEWIAQQKGIDDV